MVKKRIGEVLQRVNRYWAGEAEVAATFFQRPRTKEEHLRWLKSQMVRELGWPDGRLTRVMEAYKEVEKETDRHLVHDLLINAEEEYSHHVVLADIAEELAGKRITPEEIEYNRELPEWKALAAVRTRQGEWDAAVSGFHFRTWRRFTRRSSPPTKRGAACRGIAGYISGAAGKERGQP